MSPTHVAPSSQKLSLLTLAVLLFGLMMLFSASSVLGLQRFESEFYYVIRQGLAALFGLVLMAVLSRIPYQYWQKWALAFIAIQVLLVVATYIPVISHSVQGVRRWIELGPIRFQPSELAKITVPIFAAQLLYLWQVKRETMKRLIPLCLPIPLLLLLILKQPDLGSTILLSAVLLGMFFISGTRPLYLFSLMGFGIAIVSFSLLTSSYQQRRLVAFLNPWADPQGSGFQLIQSFLSFHSGKLFGVGLGNGNSKLFFLPEVHTDFIFALVGEELGFIGAAGLLVFFLYLAYLLLKVVRHAPDRFGCLLAFGLTLSLILQVAVNVGGVTGVLPVKGLPLPYISWGRSSLVVNLALMGILLNVARQSEIISPNAVKRKKRRRKS